MTKRVRHSSVIGESAATVPDRASLIKGALRDASPVPMVAASFRVAMGASLLSAEGLRHMSVQHFPLRFQSSANRIIVPIRSRNTMESFCEVVSHAGQGILYAAFSPYFLSL
jgi:hypothetical protein